MLRGVYVYIRDFQRVESVYHKIEEQLLLSHLLKVARNHAELRIRLTIIYYNMPNTPFF